MSRRITIKGLFEVMEGLGFQHGNGTREEKVINHEDIVFSLGNG